MAILEHHPKGRRIDLQVRTLIGRATECDVCIDDAGVSSEHAVIQFEVGGWTVRDLNSANGTRLGGQALGARPHPLALHDWLCFGSAPGEWVLVDDAPPAWLQPLPEGEVLPLTRVPRSLSPNIVVRAYVRERAIFLERAQGLQELRDGEVIEVPGARFRVVAPVSTSTALTQWSLKEARLWVQAASNHEHFDVAFTVGGRRFDIDARERNVLFHNLAKARLDDRRKGVAAEEEGWVLRSKLAKPGTAEAFRNNLKRSRDDVGNLGIFRHNESIFEKRGGGYIRLSIADVRVDAPRTELEAFPAARSAASRPPSPARRRRA
jgi:hypothetical protein